MKFPEVLDPDGKFVRRDDGLIAFAFGKYNGEPVNDVARTDRPYLEWIVNKDFRTRPNRSRVRPSSVRNAFVPPRQAGIRNQIARTQLPSIEVVRGVSSRYEGPPSPGSIVRLFAYQLSDSSRRSR